MNDFDDEDEDEDELDFDDDKTDDLFQEWNKPEPEDPSEPFDSGRESDRKADAHFASRMGYR